MRKLSTLTLALILTLPWLAGCNSGDQGPFKEQTVLSPGTGLGTPSNRPGTDRPSPYSVGPDRFPTGPIISSETLPDRGSSLPANFDIDHPPADMILATVYFDFDQFNVNPDDRKLLEAAAKVMAADPSITVVAVGHCDHFGSEQYNLALGDRRSNAVKAYLTRNGAGAAQTEVLSRGNFGATPDVGKNSPEAKHDRRVDVVKIPAGVTLPSGPPSATTAVMGAP